MVISEIFCSIQGEGTYVGVPSFFIRTSGCCLRCQFCDTKYSSFGKKIEGKLLTVENIIDQLKNTKEWFTVDHVVITGGEPMIQKELIDLVNQLKYYNKIVTIETNGTIYRPLIKADLFSISPKTKNSYPKNSTYLKIHKKNNKNLISELKKFIHKPCIPYQLKFVYNSKDDLKEILKIVNTLHIPKNNVFLMPQGKTKEEIDSKSLELIEVCKQTGFTLSTRLHITLWGTKRGV